MEFGIPKEVRDLESRVGLTPAGVSSLVRRGHTVYVEKGAGVAAGFSDETYRHSGGNIVYSAAEVYGRSDTVVKVTRPTAAEHALFRPGQTILGFLHMAVASSDFLDALREHEITAIASEMIAEPNGDRPILVPMSEVAGRLAPVVAGRLLMTPGGGRGTLLAEVGRDSVVLATKAPVLLAPSIALTSTVWTPAGRNNESPLAQAVNGVVAIGSKRHDVVAGWFTVNVTVTLTVSADCVPGVVLITVCPPPAGPADSVWVERPLEVPTATPVAGWPPVSGGDVFFSLSRTKGIGSRTLTVASSPPQAARALTATAIPSTPRPNWNVRFMRVLPLPRRASSDAPPGMPTGL